MSEKNIMIVDTVEALEKRIEEVREAQRIFSTYSQEQVDKIFAAAALAANKNPSCKTGSCRNRHGHCGR